MKASHHERIRTLYSPFGNFIMPVFMDISRIKRLPHGEGLSFTTLN